MSTESRELPEPRFYVDSVKADRIRPENLASLGSGHVELTTYKTIQNDEPLYTADQMFAALAHSRAQDSGGEAVGRAFNLDRVYAGLMATWEANGRGKAEGSHAADLYAWAEDVFYAAQYIRRNAAAEQPAKVEGSVGTLVVWEERDGVLNAQAQNLRYEHLRSGSYAIYTAPQPAAPSAQACDCGGSGTVYTDNGFKDCPCTLTQPAGAAVEAVDAAAIERALNAPIGINSKVRDCIREPSQGDGWAAAIMKAALLAARTTPPQQRSEQVCINGMGIARCKCERCEHSRAAISDQVAGGGGVDALCQQIATIMREDCPGSTETQILETSRRIAALSTRGCAPSTSVTRPLGATGIRTIRNPFAFATTSGRGMGGWGGSREH